MIDYGLKEFSFNYTYVVKLLLVVVEFDAMSLKREVYQFKIQ